MVKTSTTLMPLSPVFLSYVLSFIHVGIYWNNHHHMLHAVHHVNGAVLWSNLHLLFWLSLIPFVTGWMGENHFAPLPVALYGAVARDVRVRVQHPLPHVDPLSRTRFGARDCCRQRFQGQCVRRALSRRHRCGAFNRWVRSRSTWLWR